MSSSSSCSPNQIGVGELPAEARSKLALVRSELHAALASLHLADCEPCADALIPIGHAVGSEICLEVLTIGPAPASIHIYCPGSPYRK